MKCTAGAESDFDSAPSSPPLDVDDPGTPGCNKWEINVLASGDLTKNEQNFQLPLLDINYDIGNNLQLKFEVPYTQSQKEESTKSELGSSKIGVKLLFYGDEESKLQLGFYPQIEIFNATSNPDLETQSPGGTITTLPLLIAKKIGENSMGEIMLTTNISYNISTKSDVSNFAALALGIGTPVLNHTALMGELSTEQSLTTNSEGIREQLIKANFGTISAISKNIFAYGSIGQSIYASDETHHTYVLAGLRVLAN